VVTREMKSFMCQAPRREVAPNLTITSFSDGMTTTYCSWYSLAAKASLGASGQGPSIGFPSLSRRSAKRRLHTCPEGLWVAGYSLLARFHRVNKGAHKRAGGISFGNSALHADLFLEMSHFGLLRFMSETSLKEGMVAHGSSMIGFRPAIRESLRGAPGRIFLNVRYSVAQKKYTIRCIDPPLPRLYPVSVTSQNSRPTAGWDTAGDSDRRPQNS
jgi:hypothetical protein